MNNSTKITDSILPEKKMKSLSLSVYGSRSRPARRVRGRLPAEASAQAGRRVSMPSENEMKKAVYGKDTSYDGIFFVAVKSTGIFCRPSCPARKPNEENIVFYAEARDALFSGYRPCKRCRPLEIGAGVPAWAGKLLKMVDEEPDKRIKDSDLRKIGVEPSRARRYFLKNYGITFQAYSRSRRLGKALSQIREGSDLDEVILGNGYESHSGFRDAFSKTFGVTPGRSQNKNCVLTAMWESPLGPIIIASNSDGVCMVEFSDRRMLEYQVRVLKKYFGDSIVPGRNKYIEQVEDELKEYFAGNLRSFKVPLIYPGTDFQRKVWNELRKIPYGSTISYEELARRIGIKKASRAVGTANGMNRIAIIIPCHRVVNKDGKLGGYGGGVWRKKRLLELEVGKDEKKV
jgi:AraC family transcriptional regulator of adaptative response/methylated-DNA-[protein]-cysteine methyltransferase